MRTLLRTSRAARTAALIAAALTVAALCPVRAAQKGRYRALPSEIPAHFTPVTRSFDYVRRDVMIPMRDGVKLNTEILIPKGIKHAGIVLTRTPYDAAGMTSGGHSPRLGVELRGDDDLTRVLLQEGFIRVVQDVRGKFGSQGDYVMNRPVRGPLNRTPVSEATDCRDTIDWLVKHVAQSNGRVAVIGTSYDGFEALMCERHPAPALKLVIAENPMVDGWMGDDWFHHGAFREQMLPYIYSQESSRSSSAQWWSAYHDDYSQYLRAGTAERLAAAHGMDQLGFWRKLLANPSYDVFWRDQAVDKILARHRLRVPLLLAAGEWDQEDIYGALAVYRALAPKDPQHTRLFLALGPWYHGQENLPDASSLGPLEFGSNTARYYQQHIARPLLAHFLERAAPREHVAPVNAYVTGPNRWEAFRAWPGCQPRCAIERTALYLEPHHRLGFRRPPPDQIHRYDEYVSDPAHPVPYRPRPVPPAGSRSWQTWLLGDQRFAAARTDVLTYETPRLRRAVRVTGRPRVHLWASSSGTDADWVVKVIDVYPPQDAQRPQMGGYELPVSMDIFRGRYRKSYAHPAPLTPNVALRYRFHLPAVDHVFEPGHRIMVQIQSSWFPLYDRNPQTYVRNIFAATRSEYHKAVERVFHQAPHESYIALPLAVRSRRHKRH